MDTYEVWDLAGGSIIDTFPTERAALDWIRAAVEEEGSAVADGLALLLAAPDGRRLIAEEGELVSRAATVS